MENFNIIPQCQLCNKVAKDNWVGYLEDRRPASNCDPYNVARLIVETTLEVDGE